LTFLETFAIDASATGVASVRRECGDSPAKGHKNVPHLRTVLRAPDCAPVDVLAGWTGRDDTGLKHVTNSFLRAASGTEEHDEMRTDAEEAINHIHDGMG